MKIYFLTLATLMISISAQAVGEVHQFQLQTTFQSGHRNLTSEARAALADQITMQKNLFRELLRDRGVNPDSGVIAIQQVSVQSRTDTRGTAESNLAISQERAANLAQDVKTIFQLQQLNFTEENILAVGLGESEADEALCRRTEYICSREKKTDAPALEGLSGSLLARICRKASALILPRAHAQARSQSLFDLLFNDNSGPQPVQQPFPEQEVFETEPMTCEQVRWDDDCLAQQRVSTIDIAMVFEDVKSGSADGAVIETTEELPEVPVLAPREPINGLDVYGSPYQN